MVIEPIQEATIQQTERLQALYHLAVELSAQHTLESVLETALKHCLELTGSQFGFIGLTTADQQAMDVVAVQGFHASPAFYQHFRLIPLRPNIFAKVVLENRCIVSDDALSDPRRVGQPDGHPPVTTFLGVPLRIQEAPIGMIGLANRKQPYEIEHEHLLMTYAAQVAILIRNAQLYDELAAAKTQLEQTVERRTRQLNKAKEALARKAAQLQQLYNKTVDIQEHERQRIAHDMHDGINQLLIGAMLELRSARQRITTGNLNEADEALDAVHEILHNVEAEIKRIIYDLRPPTLDVHGFVPAVRRCVQNFREYAQTPCTLQTQGKVFRLPEKTEVNIYRLLQEALQNVYAHAGATHVKVNIRFSAKSVTLSVFDDGCGFDLDTIQQTSTEHFGLITMQERANNLDGTLVIETRPNRGTKLKVVVPIKKQPGSV